MNSCRYLFAAVTSLVIAVGCGAPKFSVGSPPSLPGSSVRPPDVPDAQQKKAAGPSADSVAVTVHKTRDVPDLRGRLLALVRLEGDPAASARLEELLTLGLVDKGVTRLIPGQALAEVTGSLERSEGAARGSVKLTSKLAALSLVTQASGADYLLYGILVPAAAQSETLEVGYEIPAEQLQEYRRAYAEFSKAVAADLRSTQRLCDNSLATYESEMEQFRKAGGRPGPAEGAPSEALRAQQEYAGFRTSCAAAQAQLRTRLEGAPAPDKLVAEASRRKAQLTANFSSFSAVVKLRQASTDETFWIGNFEVRAPTADAAVRALADKIVSEFSQKWGDAPPPAPEPDKKAKKKP